MMSANSRIRFGLQIVFVCLYITPSHYRHCANFIWRHYNLSSVWVRLSIFIQLSIIQYVGLCVLSLPISFVMIEIIYIICLIIIIKSEVWTITHCLGLGNETIVCAVCLSIFLLDLWDGYTSFAYTISYIFNLPSRQIVIGEQQSLNTDQNWTRCFMFMLNMVRAGNVGQAYNPGKPLYNQNSHNIYITEYITCYEMPDNIF